jgi:hypothetical protein
MIFLAIQTYYENLLQYKIGSNLSFCAIIQKTLYLETSRSLNTTHRMHYNL